MKRTDIPKMVPMHEVKRRVRLQQKEEVNRKEEKAAAKIKGIDGVYAGAVFPVTTRIVMGRGAGVSHIVYPDNHGAVSRAHCRIQPVDKNHIELIDLNSSNGTYLGNGIRLTPNVPYKLEKGDVFYLADPKESFFIL